MATIKIKDLPEANLISDSNLVILEDADTTRKAAGQTLIHYIENHPDINSRFLTRDGLGAAGETAPLDGTGKLSSDYLNFGKAAGTVYEGSEGQKLEDAVASAAESLDAKADASVLNAHTKNTGIHVSAEEKAAWNAAKTHADSLHARTDATKTESSAANGSIKINGADTKVYTHPDSGAAAGTYTSVTVDTSGHITAGSNPTVPVTKGGTGATTAAAALKNLGITASAEELNILSGATITAEELNSLKDATDSIQSQLDEKASAASLNSHTGNAAVHITAAERTNWNLAKTHADSAHARTDATKTEASAANGSIKINGADTKVYVHPASGATAGTYTSVTVDSQGHITAGTNPTIPVSRGGTGATTAAAALSNLGLTATAAELNKLDGITAGTAELNYVKGVTSAIQTQLNGKAAASHGNHVPAIDAASSGKVLKSNGSASAWSALTSQDITSALGYVPGTGGEYGIATESTPGLVKSGTDITVDTAGNMSVKDNSHSHTVANVTGLQSALDGKSASTHTHSNYASAVTVTGSGNAVTAVAQSGNTITATKGSTFLTAHPTVSMATNTTSSASSLSFTAVDSVTKDTFGHVTKVNTKTVTVPKYTVVSAAEPAGQAANDIWSKEY